MTPHEMNADDLEAQLRYECLQSCLQTPLSYSSFVLTYCCSRPPSRDMSPSVSSTSSGRTLTLEETEGEDLRAEKEAYDTLIIDGGCPLRPVSLEFDVLSSPGQCAEILWFWGRTCRQSLTGLHGNRKSPREMIGRMSFHNVSLYADSLKQSLIAQAYTLAFARTVSVIVKAPVSCFMISSSCLCLLWT